MKNSVVDTTAAKKTAGEGKKEAKKKGSDIVKKGVKGVFDILK